MTKHEMILSLERYIHQTARRHLFHIRPGDAVDYDDLVARGWEAACEAANRFKPKLGWRFITYAGPWITQAIRREAEHSKTIYIPERQQRKVQRGEDGPTIAYLRLDKKINRWEGRATWHDVIGAEPVVDTIDQQRAGAKVRALAEQARTVMTKFFWDDFELVEIAQQMNTYPEQVRRIREKSLSQLREQMAP